MEKDLNNEVHSRRCSYVLIQPLQADQFSFTGKVLLITSAFPIINNRMDFLSELNKVKIVTTVSKSVRIARNKNKITSIPRFIQNRIRSESQSYLTYTANVRELWKYTKEEIVKHKLPYDLINLSPFTDIVFHAGGFQLTFENKAVLSLAIAMDNVVTIRVYNTNKVCVFEKTNNIFLPDSDLDFSD